MVQTKKGFTVIEMMLVLLVISVILLITLPNIAQKKQIINNIGCQSLIEVVNSQVLMFNLENGRQPDSLSELVEEGYLKEDQLRCPNDKAIELDEAGQAVVR